MPMEIKGNAGRKPPEPVGDPLRYRRLVPAPDAASAAHRRGVRRVDPSDKPGLHYAVKWKRPYYGLSERGG